MIVPGASYLVYRRTRDGRLLFGLRLPGWLLVAAAVLTLAGAGHLAWRATEILSYRDLSRRVDQARQERLSERTKLVVMQERLSELRGGLEPVAILNGKLAALTNLAQGGGGQPAAMGAPSALDGGYGGEKRLARQLTALARSLMEEAAFQEARQRQLSSILRERALEFAARPSLWPVRGNINSSFGFRLFGQGREFHKGVDIASPVGTPVRAPADGKVVAVGYESGYGLMVVLEHRHGIATAYAHLREAVVSEGDTVTRGSRIALSGMSGRTTGAHLHYEVRFNGQPVDPMNFMLD